MIDNLFRIIKKFIPRRVFEFFQPAYHYLLALTGAIIYSFPSKKMIVIGVTGTKGKTTTSNLIAHILQEAGFKTGLATTVNFKIGEKEFPNTWKQTMGGRFKLQNLLKQMVKAGCKYAVVETSSEGILQYRQRFIDYDVAVFANISPEHLERHKGFENYRNAKIKLFEQVAKKSNGIGVYNLDDENISWFLKSKIYKKLGYTFSDKKPTDFGFSKDDVLVKISDISFDAQKTEFKFNGRQFSSNLIGKFNIENMAAAICVGLSQNVPVEKMISAIKNFKSVSGRMEIINEAEKFCVVVDYAHEPKSLESVYKAAIESGLVKKGSKIICLLGSTGGGRDKWKRPEMGKIASAYCQKIILTNEDPYDEDPSKIIADVKAGISEDKINNGDVYEIIDREKAIEKAYSLAQEGDAVILTGKGGEVWMCMENGRKIPWDEKQIATKILKKFL